MDAAEWLSRRRRGCVVAPAGVGKTRIAAMALDLVMQRRKQSCGPMVGVMVNTREQVDQFMGAFAVFSSIVHDTQHVSVKCAAAEPDWSCFDVLIVDEVHHLKTAPTWQAAVATCKGAVWGLTATPWGEDEDENLYLREFFGGEFHEISRAVIADSITTAHVTLHDASDRDIKDEIDAAIAKTMGWRRRFWQGSEGELWGMVAWQECVKRGIVGNAARNNAAVLLALRHREESVLLLVGQIAHGKELCARIPGSQVCTSKLTPKRRAAMVAGFRDGSIPCLIATSLADEAFDAPIASVLVLVSGGRNESRTIQRAGRVCRRYPGKDHAVIHDFADLYHPLAAKHSRRRVETYRSLGYEVRDAGTLV